MSSRPDLSGFSNPVYNPVPPKSTQLIKTGTYKHLRNAGLYIPYAEGASVQLSRKTSGGGMEYLDLTVHKRNGELYWRGVVNHKKSGTRKDNYYIKSKAALVAAVKADYAYSGGLGLSNGKKGSSQVTASSVTNMVFEAMNSANRNRFQNASDPWKLVYESLSSGEGYAKYAKPILVRLGNQVRFAKGSKGSVASRIISGGRAAPLSPVREMTFAAFGPEFAASAPSVQTTGGSRRNKGKKATQTHIQNQMAAVAATEANLRKEGVGTARGNLLE